MTASPRDAVSAAGPLCTHGKDKPGLGAPNSLKLLIITFYYYNRLRELAYSFPWVHSGPAAEKA